MRALIWISYSADTYSGWGCECGQAFMPSHLLCGECKLGRDVLEWYDQGGFDSAVRVIQHQAQEYYRKVGLVAILPTDS